MLQQVSDGWTIESNPAYIGLIFKFRGDKKVEIVLAPIMVKYLAKMLEETIKDYEIGTGIKLKKYEWIAEAWEAIQAAKNSKDNGEADNEQE